MDKLFVKKLFFTFGLDIKMLIEKFSKWSIRESLVENKRINLTQKLREIVPDISDQESSEKESFNDYWELKRRGLQSFQISLILKALEYIPSGKLKVADIGDSAGTHMLYLKKIAGDIFDIHTTSFNLDPRAVEKIRARGLHAVLCRAEELDIKEEGFDLITSFQMIEHLHNPADFFRKLAKHSLCNRMVITVPYVNNSRVGLHYIRSKNPKNNVYAEDVHIFELCPNDWILLILHSGWKVIYNDIYYQYPMRWPGISYVLGLFWKVTDFEGFWGAILEKDTTYSDCYKDWPD